MSQTYERGTASASTTWLDYRYLVMLAAAGLYGVPNLVHRSNTQEVP